MRAIRGWLFAPAFRAPWLVALVLGGLPLGYEPTGGDPDRLYRPLKQLLVSSLIRGELPLWSDRLGLGVPLLAESHVAALYPPNWLIYTIAGPDAGSRLSMWLHHIAIAAGLYAYARFLGLSSAGSSLSALSFTFCGFMAIHSSHEPFYCALAWLAPVLLATEWLLASGQPVALCLIALSWGAQLTLGHFQLQMWTAGLALFIGAWRVVADRMPWGRLLSLGLGLTGGIGLAAVQLSASWELSSFVGTTRRSFEELAFYAFPWAHWAEVAIPTLTRGTPGGYESGYWQVLGTTGYEACLYIGTIPLILALFGSLPGGRRSLAPWWLIAVASFTLAIMPTIWRPGYAVVASIPGLGWFRAPGRYTALTSLGLALLAGRGFDRILELRRVLPGFVASSIFALLALGWASYWSLRPDHGAILGGTRLGWSLGLAVVCWIGATGLLVGCRRGKFSSSILLIATAAELGGLFYTSTTQWSWADRLPSASPVLGRLAETQDVIRLAGPLHNLPVRAGCVPAFPYTGFALPPPHPAIEQAIRYVEPANSNGAAFLAGLGLFRRLGVSHGVLPGPIHAEGVDILFESQDPILDSLVYHPPGMPDQPRWRIVRYPEPFPDARVATSRRFSDGPRDLASRLAFDSDPTTIWFDSRLEHEQRPGPPARSARVGLWDGATAIVEHDGACDLVVNRTFYPGWTAAIGDGPQRPVGRAELGIQTVALSGSGTSRVTFRYRPGWLPAASGITLSTLALVSIGLVVCLRRTRIASRAGSGM